jgi:hypothetical protein
MDVRKVLDSLADQLSDDYGICPKEFLGDVFTMCDSTPNPDCVLCWTIAIGMYLREKINAC